jgi:hypothetical protein
MIIKMLKFNLGTYKWDQLNIKHSKVPTNGISYVNIK